MEIMPNSIIKFLKNIPFDNDYNDTIYFDSPTEQETYFTNDDFVKYTIDDQYYVRHSSGVLDVELKLYQPSSTYEISTAESLYDCNYMMFQNTNFRSENGMFEPKLKWFYAFITNVEYINNQVARVTFEIDVMQTWMFDYELEQCFIEREHSETDGIGDNIVPENLDIGDSYITTWTYNALAETDHLKAYVLVARKYESDTQTYVYPIIYLMNNVPTTLWVKEFNIYTQLEDMWNFLKPYILETDNRLTPDDIVSIYLFPDDTFFEFHNTVGFARPTVFYPSMSDIETNLYIPKNQKLYTYPYIGIEVSNHEGTSQMYHYEYFVPMLDVPSINSGKSHAYFRIKGASAPSPAITCFPVNYLPTTDIANAEHSQSSPKRNDGYDYGIPISDFQQCAWVGDTFKAWWAQNKNSWSASTYTSLISGTASTVAGALTGNPYLVGMGSANLIGGVLGSLAKKSDIEHRSPSINGLSNSISLPIAFNYFGYTFRVKQISSQYAKIIDDYFSMFGYATHRVKTPNRHVRSRCTYTQTRGCTIRGRLPSAYQKEICNIYNNGIRFWDKNAEVGVYRDPSTGELYDNECL